MPEQKSECKKYEQNEKKRKGEAEIMVTGLKSMKDEKERMYKQNVTDIRKIKK